MGTKPLSWRMWQHNNGAAHRVSDSSWRLSSPRPGE